MWSARKCKPPHFCIKTSLSTISVCTEGRPLYGECGVVCVCLGVNVSRGASDAIVLELDTMASGTEVTEMNPHNQKLPAWEHKENQHRFRFSGLAAVDSPGLTSLLHPGTPGLHLHKDRTFSICFTNRALFFFAFLHFSKNTTHFNIQLFPSLSSCRSTLTSLRMHWFWFCPQLLSNLRQNRNLCRKQVNSSFKALTVLTFSPVLCIRSSDTVSWSLHTGVQS